MTEDLFGDSLLMRRNTSIARLLIARNFLCNVYTIK